jgi:hypothetical protein
MDWDNVRVFLAVVRGGWKTSPVRPDLPATALPPMKCP